MSYLNATRLHLSGNFTTDVSTVNNIPHNFDNAAKARPPVWNPNGTGDWYLAPTGATPGPTNGCQITSAFIKGQPASGDSVLSCFFCDTFSAGLTKIASKLVDLDSEQQMVSEIWAMQVCIMSPSGSALMRGVFRVAAFADYVSQAIYQSVIENVVWGDLSGSPFLQALQAAAGTGPLSIKFNVYNPFAAVQPPPCQGQVVGTIGPALANEPAHLVIGRHFVQMNPAASSNNLPTNLNNCVATVDSAASLVYLDLGNALGLASPPIDPTGSLQDVGALTLAYASTSAPSGWATLGTIPYTAPGWYANTAGVVTLPLTAAQLQAAQTNILGLLLDGSTANGVPESQGGMYVRADQFVYRLYPGDTAAVKLYAMQFGQPLAGATVVSQQDPSQFQGPPPPTNPPVQTPANAIQWTGSTGVPQPFPASLVTDANGVATLAIATTDPGTPRTFDTASPGDAIDGQVYGVRPMLQATQQPLSSYPFNPAETVNILLWSTYQAANPPTWVSLQPFFQQYANLYPVMKQYVDLSSYDSICQNRQAVLYVLQLPLMDPNSMPVTRDLSTGKRQTMIDWLTNVGRDGKPLYGLPVNDKAAIRAQMLAKTGH